MARIVILGAGLGGMSAAYAIRHELSSAHAVTVVGNGPWFSFAPSNPWVAVGWRASTDIQLDAGKYLSRHDIEFIDDAAVEIRPDENRLLTRRGRSVDYDYLVVATGSRLAFDEVPGLGPSAYTQSVCTTPHAEQAWVTYQAFVKKPGPVVVGAVQGASSFEPAYELAMIVDADLRQRKLRGQVPMTFVTSEPYVGHLGLGGVGDSQALLESELRKRHIRWIANARIAGIKAESMRIEELGVHGQVVLEHGLPFAWSMLIPAFTGVDAVRGVPGLVDHRGFVLTDKHQRSPEFPNIFAAGACVESPPVDVTPVPTGAPTTGFTLESMVSAIAANLSDELAGRPAVAETTRNVVCLVDFGETGAAFVALPQTPPRIVAQATVSHLAHMAKLEFEKYFLAKMRAGSGEPIYEKYVLPVLGNERAHPAPAAARLH